MPTQSKSPATTAFGPLLLGEMKEHLGSHSIELESDQIKLSPMLSVDVEREMFVGDNAAKANGFLKREYRKGYEVPTIV